MNRIEYLQQILQAQDDAKEIKILPIREILNGTYQMAFTHVYFVLESLKKINSFSENPELKLFIEQSELILNCSIYRNTKIIFNVNALFSHINSTYNKSLKMLTITEQMNQILNFPERLIQRAFELNVNINGYLQLDKADVISCSNEFCQNQKLDGPGMASDNLIIFRDFYGELYLITIVRKFGPGQNNVALAGGFCDPNETHEQTAERECNEEIGGIKELFNLKFKNIDKWIIPEHFSYYWDPRGKFPYGMIVGASVKYFEFIE